MIDDQLLRDYVAECGTGNDSDTVATMAKELLAARKVIAGTRRLLNDYGDSATEKALEVYDEVAS